ncbi:MAG: enamine deaminase RidA (YjgF/YER057c/UK114 family) [Gammaproteobacteria bacterium]
MQKIAREAGLSLKNVARIVLYLEAFADFVAFDAVCKHYLPDNRPALSPVEIPRASPVPGARICIEAIAVST